MFFLLTAITESGRTVSLLGNWEKHELQQLTQKETLLCPACHEKVRIKTGEKRIWHFAHISKLNCEAQLENESEYHLKGKIQLYEWLQKQGIDVEVEKYLPKSKQRPDLYVTWQNQDFAIEFQCSTIDASLLMKRTTSYLRENIIPLWILGGNRLKKSSVDTIKISSFDLLMANSISTNNLRLIYYCPSTNRFCITKALIPFASNTFSAVTEFYNPNDLSFPMLITSRDTENYPKKETWLAMKRRFRSITYLYIDDSYKRLFYENGIPLCFLPGEAGIPVRSMIWLKTGPMLWQGWILLKFIIPLKIGERITFQDIYQGFKMQVQKGFFTLRQLPSLKDSHYSFAIMEYLQQLARLGIVAKDTERKSTFRKTADLTIPKNIDQACELDRTVLLRLIL